MIGLNERAARRFWQAAGRAARLKIRIARQTRRLSLLDFGLEVAGSLRAGIELARICTAGLAAIAVERSAEEPGQRQVRVATRHPLRACLGSQYAGWRWDPPGYFALCSGPIRAARGREPIVQQYGLAERAAVSVAILETDRMPDAVALRWVRQKMQHPPGELLMAAARTSSLAGSVQVVARSVETALHKMHEIGFDLSTVESAVGIAPCPPRWHPSAAADRVAMGVCNDAILLGGLVQINVRADPVEVAELGPRIPSCSSPQFGRPFAELLAEFGGDFYRLDPLLFAPAELLIRNTWDGRTHRFGCRRLDAYRESVAAARAAEPALWRDDDHV